MKPAHLRFGASLLALFALSFAHAEPVAQIYDARSGFLSGWSATTWGNLDAQHSKVSAPAGGSISLLVSPAANAANYAGVILEAGMAGSIPLSDDLRTKGEVRLLLRNGRDLAGKPAREQVVQTMLSFQPVGGKSINGRYEQVPLDAVSSDDATTGWQLVTLSIPRQLTGRVDPATPVRLRAVYLQYVDQHQASFFVGSCTVEEGAAQPK